MRRRKNISRTDIIARAAKRLGDITVMNTDAVGQLINPKTGVPWIDDLKAFGDRLPGNVLRKSKAGRSGKVARERASDGLRAPLVMDGMKNSFRKALDELGADPDLVFAAEMAIEKQGVETNRALRGLERNLNAKGYAPLSEEETQRLKDFTEEVSRARIQGKSETQAVTDTMIGFEFPGFQSGLIPTDADAFAGVLPQGDEETDPGALGGEREATGGDGLLWPPLPDATEGTPPEDGFLGDSPPPPDEASEARDATDEREAVRSRVVPSGALARVLLVQDDEVSEALLKRPEDLSEREVRRIIDRQAALGAGDPESLEGEALLQAFFERTFGSGHVRHDATGRPIEPTPITSSPETPRPARTADGAPLTQALDRLGRELERASGERGSAGAVQALQRGLNRAHERIAQRQGREAGGTGPRGESRAERLAAARERRALSEPPLMEDGILGPKTRARTKRTMAILGERAVAELFDRQLDQRDKADAAGRLEPAPPGGPAGFSERSRRDLALGR